MDDWHTLFSGNEEATKGLSDAVAAAGLRVYTRTTQGPIVTRSGGRAYSTEVLVPPEAREEAEQITLHWRAQHAHRVSELSFRIGRIALLSLAPVSMWWCTHLLGIKHVPIPTIEWSLVIWILSVVAIAQVEHRRRRSERIELAAFYEGDSVKPSTTDEAGVD